MSRNFLSTLWRSKSKEYFILKLAINLPVGLTIGVGYYYAVIHRLELREEIDTLVGNGMITCITIGYIVSKNVRCTSFLLIPTLFSKEGRFWLSTFTYSLLITGPIRNVIINSEEAIRSVTCSVSFFAKHRAEKLKFAAAPLIGFSQRIGISLTTFDKELKDFKKGFSPSMMSYGNIVDDDGSVADDYIYSPEHSMYGAEGSQNDEQKALKQEESSQRNQRKVNAIKKTMGHRCKKMFDKATDDCSTVFMHRQEQCKRKFLINTVSDCSLIDGGSLCAERNIGNEECDPERAVSPEFEKSFRMQEIEASDSTSDVKIQSKEVVYDRKINQTSQQDVTESIKNEFESRRKVLEFITLSLKRLVVFTFVLVVHRAYKYNYKYRTDIKFDNCYITDYFNKIDMRRYYQDKKVILPLKGFEKKQVVPLLSLKLTSEQKKNMIKRSIFLILKITVACVIIAADYISLDILNILNKHGKLTVHQEGIDELLIYVNGTGSVSKMMRGMTEYLNFTYVTNQTITNTVCLPNPSKLPSDRIKIIAGMFFMQFLLIALEGYALRLRPLFGSLFYRKREKKRILHLYNDMRKQRYSYLQRARHQIRRKAILQQLKREAPQFQLPCTKASQACKCLVCETKLKPSEAIQCPHEDCGFCYCEECWEDCKGVCIVCTRPKHLDKVLSELTVVSEMEITSTDSN